MNFKPEDILIFIQKLDEKKRSYLIGGLILFVFCLNIFLIVRPQLIRLGKINTEIKTLSGNLAKAKEDIQKKNQYAKEVQQLTDAMAVMHQRIKSKEDISLILATISRIANDHSIKIDQISPEIDKQILVLDKGATKYFSLPIHIEARTSYHNWGKFFNQLEQEDLVLTVTNFNMKVTNDPKYHQLTLILNAIVSEQSGSVPEPKGKR